jgi:DNA-binding GntR family transcriptional regulator
MDSATLKKFRGQLNEFSHHLAEFEAAMAQGKADNPAALREHGAQFSTCFAKYINSPHLISGTSRESATFVFIFSCRSSPSQGSESGLSPQLYGYRQLTYLSS